MFWLRKEAGKREDAHTKQGESSQNSEYQGRRWLFDGTEQREKL